MEIIVEGKGSEFFTPDEVILNLNFQIKGATYEDVLTKGSNAVLEFVNNLLLKLGFSKEDMKTRNFIIKEDTKYNEVTRKYDFDGYSYNQSSIVRFDYDIKKVASIMEQCAILSNPPYCHIDFGIKDEKEPRKSVLSKAYQDAKDKAEAIAIASGKQLQKCMKIDFQPFTTNYNSNSRLGNEMFYSEKAIKGSADVITNIFTPEDVEISEKLYCLWIAE